MGTDADHAAGSEILVDMELVCLRVAGRTLIKDFTLRLKSCTRIGLTGPSGCGKTTLLRSIVGRRLTVDSAATRFDVAPGRVGYAPQQGGMLPWYSLRRNLRILAALGASDGDGWCDEVLARMELAHAGATFPAQLSGGELQRARLACAIATRPTLFCADEPLTEVGLRQKWRLLKQWSVEMHERRTGLLLVSHDVDTLMYLCDEILVLGGTPGDPARTVGCIDVSVGGHPRNPADLGGPSFESVRRRIVDEVYLERPGSGL
jgi:ABC-type nitrate/sulfonate/bicarbonate transport system ATPase subunit